VTERLLQFIWQFQYFNKNELATTAGEDLQVIFPGQYNTNQGPDFTTAKIRIGNTLWAGTVELHIMSGDWQKHHHQNDSNYQNVILHVVWEDDVAFAENNPLQLPVLELKGRISTILLQRYEELMNSSSFIPCEKSIQSVQDIVWKSWKERLLVERLLRKAATVELYLSQNKYHWEETFWWLLARNFGMKINADAFEAVARSVPLTILSKQKEQIHQLEALLLGQAGLLQYKFEEDYPRLLQREYRFQQNKHRIRPVPIPFLFLRMRPGNFPSVRLAQLAMLIHNSAHLFARIKDASVISEIYSLFDVTANDYWDYHYRLDELSTFKKKRLGVSMIDNIMINTIIPVLFAYGNYHAEEKYKERAVQWMEGIKGERNSIIHGFNEISVESNSSYDSQALLELKNEYCDKKRCLECSVGNAILRHTS
jgi:hypothetical protein